MFVFSESLFLRIHLRFHVFLEKISYWSQLAGVQLAGGRGGGLPSPLLKAEKKCPDFENKCPVCAHLWVKFSFKIQFLEYLGEKTPIFFPCAAFLREAFIELSLYQ